MDSIEGKPNLVSTHDALPQHDNEALRGALESGNFQEIYKAWRDSLAIDTTDMNRAVTALTRPYDQTLEYFYSTAGVGVLINTAAIGNETSPHPLRDALDGQPEKADSLADSMIAWYRSLRTESPDDLAALANLQLEFHEVMLEILPLLSIKTRERLYDHYPVMGAIHGQEHIIDAAPTIELLYDDGIPADLRHRTIEKWLVATELPPEPTPEDIRKHAILRKELGSFVEAWAAMPSAEPACIAKIIGFLERQSSKTITGDGLVLYEPYIHPEHIGRVARYLPEESRFDLEVRYDFAARHILYQPAKVGDPPALQQYLPEHADILTWLEEQVKRRLHPFNFFGLTKPVISDEDKRLQQRIDEIWQTAKTRKVYD